MRGFKIAQGKLGQQIWEAWQRVEKLEARRNKGNCSGLRPGGFGFGGRKVDRAAADSIPRRWVASSTWDRSISD